MAVWPLIGGDWCWEIFYESLTFNSAGTFFTDHKSGGGHCAEVTVIRGSTVVIIVQYDIIDDGKSISRNVPSLNMLFHDVTYYIMNIEQISENISTYFKTHYGEAILAKIHKLQKTMIK